MVVNLEVPSMGLGISPQSLHIFQNLWNNAHKPSSVLPQMENTTLGQIEFSLI